MDKNTLNNLQKQCVSIIGDVNYLRGMVIQMQESITKMEESIELLNAKNNKPKKVWFQLLTTTFAYKTYRKERLFI